METESSISGSPSPSNSVGVMWLEAGAGMTGGGVLVVSPGTVVAGVLGGSSAVSVTGGTGGEGMVPASTAGTGGTKGSGFFKGLGSSGSTD